MDKERIMKEAANFMGDGDGYIHSEMKNGKSPQLVISGDIMGIMWQVCGIFNRLSEITGNSFDEVAFMTINMPKLGYGNLKSITKDNKKKVYVGEDWNEQWKKETESKLKREANMDNISLAFNLAEMEKRCTSLNNQLVDAKKKYSKDLKAKDEQIKSLTKECQSLEHRMKEMEQQRMFGGDE